MGGQQSHPSAYKHYAKVFGVSAKPEFHISCAAAVTATGDLPRGHICFPRAQQQQSSILCHETDPNIVKKQVVEASDPTL